MKCRLSERLLDHPMKEVSGGSAEACVRRKNRCHRAGGEGGLGERDWLGGGVAGGPMQEGPGGR